VKLLLDALQRIAESCSQCGGDGHYFKADEDDRHYRVRVECHQRACIIAREALAAIHLEARW
jgi:hypothetical protein